MHSSAVKTTDGRSSEEDTLAHPIYSLGLFISFLYSLHLFISFLYCSDGEELLSAGKISHVVHMSPS